MLVTEAKGIGPKKAKLLENLGIKTTDDMLSYYPSSYENRTRITPISEAEPGTSCLVRGTVESIKKFYPRGRGKKIMYVRIADDSGEMNIVFFRAEYYERSFEKDRTYFFYGHVQKGQGKLCQMVHPEFEDGEKGFTAKILPIYRTTTGITQSDLRKLAEFSLSAATGIIRETLPEKLLEEKHICSRDTALRNIHFPKDKETFKIAKYRLIYEEFFILQTGLFLKGSSSSQMREGIDYPHSDAIKDFISSLSYTPTNAQLRVMKEIENDMESPLPMQRLVQGDVGSGKTAVAAAALYKAATTGFQGVIMAPTALLASQHYETFSETFKDTDIQIGYLASALKAKEKRDTLEKLKTGEIDILVGTHAVISENVEFKQLGLVITDEQHRFGVDQRKALAAKGNGISPDILVMTATPIPRTLAVILFGDLDISVIDELPPGRQKIITKTASSKQRSSVYSFVRKQLELGLQAYCVAPLVDDSEAVDAMSAISLYEDLTKRFPDRNVGLVHGTMKQDEKDRVMKEFADGKIDILAATVVIEVGINVPNASVMVIENAERFGLAQLHQLRGRVGRGTSQSYCILITDPSSELGQKRAEIIENSTDGFYIAEMDLNMRGPGEFFGTRQHGLPELYIADLARHIPIFNAAKDGVREVVTDDPHLEKPQNASLRASVEKMFGGTGDIGL